MIDKKFGAVILIVLLSLILTIYLLLFNNTQTDPSVFFKNWETADEVGLVLDITNTNIGTEVQTNILQCGTDYISSAGHLIQQGKLSYYVIDQHECYMERHINMETSSNTPVSTSSCKKEYSQHPYILVVPGNSAPEFYENYAVVYINQDYIQGQCSLYG
ncbi:hypothetical protein KO465_01050 [Candidatus Micrarchaeota archaeon]|jgi:hypothetical protein|nr:hypothetical protein [Candidatus Micrarchaeota archaeon]